VEAGVPNKQTHNGELQSCGLKNVNDVVNDVNSISRMVVNDSVHGGMGIIVRIITPDEEVDAIVEEGWSHD
jgi:hypothetical protein